MKGRLLEGSATTRYCHYDIGGNIVGETDEIGTGLVKYVRDTDGQAISMTQGYDTYYFLYNAHGDVIAVTDNYGKVVASYFYDEFGNTSSSTGNIYNPLRYSGANNAYFDEETGFYKMGARYYSPEVGRWLTRDIAQGEDLQSMNKYAYTENNPVTYIDPTGYKAWSYKRYANKQDLANYQQWVPDNKSTYLGKDHGDCADLALTMLVDWAKKRGVGLTLYDGNTAIDTDNYSNKDDYLKRVKTDLGAQNLVDNTYGLNSYGQGRPGDILIFHWTKENNPENYEEDDEHDWDTKILVSKLNKKKKKKKIIYKYYYQVIHENPPGNPNDNAHQSNLYTDSNKMKDAYGKYARRWN